MDGVERPDTRIYAYIFIGVVVAMLLLNYSTRGSIDQTATSKGTGSCALAKDVDMCFLSLNVNSETGDILTCNRISNSDLQDICFMQAAQARNDASLCINVNNSLAREKCVDGVGQ